MKIYLARIFRTCFGWLGNVLKSCFMWLWQNMQSYFEPILKALGFGGLALISFDSFRDIVNGSVDKFGIFARLLQIDDLFVTINNAFSPYLVGYINTDFIGCCQAFGIVIAINQILNALGWSVLVSIIMYLFKIFMSVAVTVVKVI